jgi:hypothetical protein
LLVHDSPGIPTHWMPARSRQHPCKLF